MRDEDASMASERSQGWLQMLGSIVVLVGVTVGTVELLDYCGVRAKEVPALLFKHLSSLRPDSPIPPIRRRGPHRRPCVRPPGGPSGGS